MDFQSVVNSYSAYFPPGTEHEYYRRNYGRRWPSFTFKELASRGNGALLVNFQTMDCLQKLRDLYKGPIAVSSYYRDPDYNTKVGGAPESKHMFGQAVDTPTLNGDIGGRAKLVHLATLAGFRGFGFYERFTHLDTGPMRFWTEGDIARMNAVTGELDLGSRP